MNDIIVDTRKAIETLLSHGCPSIQYRIHRDLLGQPATSTTMRLLQAQILNDPAVMEVFSWQQPDGWLAYNFHGYHSIESGIRLLCEKGVDSDHPVLMKALHALENETDRLDRGISKVGKFLDDMGLTGSLMIRSVIFSYAGIENKPFIHESIHRALKAFKAVLAYGSMDDFSVGYRGKTALKPGCLWPGLYHLRLLAFTQSWRTPEALSEISQSVQRIYSLFPIPDLYARHRSQLIAPVSLCSSTFDPQIAHLDDAGWMLWFHRMELLARLGVIHRIPFLEDQIFRLMEILITGDGLFIKKISHPYFKNWGAYTGLMLERDWKDAWRRVYDLTFRSLLIFHYYDLWKAQG
jgi:hypothetical protein